jgi:hypothetical protein
MNCLYIITAKTVTTFHIFKKLISFYTSDSFGLGISINVMIPRKRGETGGEVTEGIIKSLRISICCNIAQASCLHVFPSRPSP